MMMIRGECKMEQGKKMSEMFVQTTLNYSTKLEKI